MKGIIAFLLGMLFLSAVTLPVFAGANQDTEISSPKIEEKKAGPGNKNVKIFTYEKPVTNSGKIPFLIKIVASLVIVFSGLVIVLWIGEVFDYEKNTK